MLWDRKQDGGFPESKELKQRIRNLVAPEKFLGHSDTKERREDCDNDAASKEQKDGLEKLGIEDPTAPKPNVSITYCTGCRWLLRAAWIAQELLTTFEMEISSVSLIPSRPPAKGGIFVRTTNVLHCVFQ